MTERALLVLPGAFGPTGGIEMFDRLLIKAFHEVMSRRGGACDVHVLLDRDGVHDPRYVDAKQPAPRGFAGSRPRFSLATLARVVASRPSIVVFGHTNFGPLALAVRAASPRAKQWFIAHGTEVWSRVRPASLVALRSAEQVLAVSAFTRRELCRANGVRLDRVSILPNALDPFGEAARREAAASTPRAKASAPTLLTVGRLAADEARKGVDHVIRALPRIAAAVPDVRYVVIGDGTDRPRLEQLAREHGVADRVLFRGRVSDRELADAYAEAWVFVMPSAQEGFGIVFLEAGAGGLPSIAGDHGGAPEVVLDGVTGRTVTHGDVGGIARRAIELLTDGASREALGERARERVATEFSYARFARILEGRVAGALDGEEARDADGR